MQKAFTNTVEPNFPLQQQTRGNSHKLQLGKFKSGTIKSFFPPKVVQHWNRWPSGTAEWTRQSYNWPDWVLVKVPIQTGNWSEWLPEVPSNKHLCDLRSKVIFIHDASSVISINSVGSPSTTNLATIKFLLSTKRGLTLVLSYWRVITASSFHAGIRTQAAANFLAYCELNREITLIRCLSFFFYLTFKVDSLHNFTPVGNCIWTS